MERLRASVIINNYNYARFLRAAIDSALSQTYQNCEVVVVDDGSTDNSRDVIESYDRRVKAVYKCNGGQGSALNAGFEASSGDLIIFLDADDVLLPCAVETVAAQMRPGLLGDSLGSIQLYSLALIPLFGPWLARWMSRWAADLADAQKSNHPELLVKIIRDGPRRESEEKNCD